jgi:zinc protease
VTPPEEATHPALDASGEDDLRRWHDEGSLAFGPRLTVHRWRLGNGLRLLLLPDAAAPVVSYHTWYRVGSRFEEAGKTGLAHFFEHLMFNETEGLAYGEFDRLMENAGGDTNAATWIDWTYYYESLPSDALPLAIRLEADRMARLVVRGPQVESEREVVANERRMSVDDDVHGAAGEALFELAYGPSHPHGWPTIGWMRDIEGYTVEDCRDFYQTWYAPNNATLIIAGDFHEDQVLRLVEDAYGGLAPTHLPVRPTPPTVRRGGERELTWPTPASKVLLGWPAPAYADPQHAVALVIDELLTGGRSARLRRRLEDRLELVSELHTSVTPLQHPGLFELWASCREGVEAQQVLDVIEEELARLVHEPVPQAELEKVRNQAELYFLSEIETVGGKAYQVGFSEIVAGDPTHGWKRLEELRRVTAEDVAALAATMFDPAARSAVFVRPEEEPAR